MKRATGLVLLAAGVALIAGGAPAARDHRAPRITAARMQDADGDTRADHVLLTYSERVRHGVDHDNTYPFAVAGYRIRSVGAAKGKTITLALVEKASPDPHAHPFVTYRPTKSKPVRDPAGNQAIRQTFRGTKSHGHAPTVVPTDTTPPETVLVSGPSGTATGRTTTFTYSSPDPTATFECGLDGAAPSSCPATGQKYDGVPDGSHTFLVRARDPAGNVDATPASRTWTVDGDGDGSIAPADCAPDNPAINPSAADAPEMTFTDTNCDGVDGNAAQAIFVSPLGNDAAAGTRAAPLRTLTAAVATALAQHKDVYATFGIYPEHLTVANAVGVYGGYGTDWSRSLVNDTRITGGNGPGGPEAAFASGITFATTLQHLTLTAPAATVAGTSSYGLRGIASPGLILDSIVVAAGAGANGGTAGAGHSGAAGKSGAPGGDGECDGITPGDGGGVSGPRTGRMGGEGGAGGQEYPLGHEDAKDGQQGAGVQGGPGGVRGGRGDPGSDGGTGSNGGSGVRGVDGAGGGAGIVFSGIFLAAAGASGTNGTDGSGGGGGGGGGGQHCTFCIDGSGDGGGEGGDGGQGGGGALGGGGGGASFGVLLVNSTGVVIKNSTLKSANGGAGGVGGVGGAGGAGGARGAGSHYCKDEIGEGGDGGLGGPGGRGGDGGGGSGGPSAALARQATTVTSSGNVFTHGAGGAGGVGAGGNGSAGVASDDLQF